jgi:hypothetical protein
MSATEAPPWLHRAHNSRDSAWARWLEVEFGGPMSAPDNTAAGTHWAALRDGNGYPRPDTRWVFTPLGYVNGLNILLMGILLGKNLHPMGKRVLERSAVTHTR